MAAPATKEGAAGARRRVLAEIQVAATRTLASGPRVGRIAVGCCCTGRQRSRGRRGGRSPGEPLGVQDRIVEKGRAASDSPRPTSACIRWRQRLYICQLDRELEHEFILRLRA